jgi:hypothetical protein
MKKEIKLGYEVGKGKEVSIKPSHLIVTGVTQLSGKTTTLEALIKRSKLKAIVFKTKIGEKSFTEGTEVPPFFRDRSDYEFVKSLIEAYAREKLFLEKGTLMRLCKGSSSLIEIKKKVDDILVEGKLRGLKEEIHTRLQHYLENLIPQIQYANLSKTLSVYDGINIMNLERFSEEAQSLIIQSVADEVLKTMKDIILVIPEAWKFLPQKYNNPCKRVVENFIRQGATNNNFVWIDSQDMAGVDKIPLKQVSTWILGYQAERNEVKHTLDQISLPKKMKPKEDEIMGLRKGHFFLSSYDGVVKVYVQPTWLDDKTAIEISKGKKNIEEIEAPDKLVPYTQATKKQEPGKVEIRFDDSKIRKDLIELRNDFFNKIQELQNFEQKLASEVYNLKASKHEINEDEIISKILQKVSATSSSSINKEEIIKEILLRVPKSVGNVVYEVAPLEKIKKDFLERAKNKILSDIKGLTDDAKLMLKYLESKAQGCKSLELEEKCYHLKHSGSASKKVSKASIELRGIGVAKKDTAGWHKGVLKERITEYLGNHEAKPEEIEQVYNHILMEMLK